VQLPVMPPIRPMLAKAVYEVPRDEGLVYEPKWDGFRCVAFRDGDEVELGSRHDRPFTRYFPEVIGALRATLPQRCAVDGELVVVTGQGLDFDTLQQRIHPAESRITMLSERTPASFVAFDLLALGDRDLREEPFLERRRLLEGILGAGRHWKPAMPAEGEEAEALASKGGLVAWGVYLTPITRDPAEAEDWFHRFEGAGFDGVMAKPADGPYLEDQRAMWKVKHLRTADCVVAGFRWHKDGEGIGSLLLGLYDEREALNHIGVASAFTAARRRELVDELAPLREGALDDHPWREWAIAEAHDGTRRLPGAPSRWNNQKNLVWEPLRPERVAEVRYEHVLSGRFRNPARMVRWRDDKRPADCRYDQLDAVAPAELQDIFG
jgi:ATP-dependent DNA ligase